MASKKTKAEEVYMINHMTGAGFVGFQMEVQPPTPLPPRKGRWHHYDTTFRGKFNARDTLLPSERWERRV